MEAEHGQRVSLDALARMMREAAGCDGAGRLARAGPTMPTRPAKTNTVGA